MPPKVEIVNSILKLAEEKNIKDREYLLVRKNLMRYKKKDLLKLEEAIKTKIRKR